MTDALDTLRPEVAEAVKGADAAFHHEGLFAEPYWQTIRAELLRLAKIEEERWAVVATRNGALERAEKAEAELAALKALLRECEPIISAYAESLHLTDGFRRRPHECDGLAEQVRAAVKVEE